MDLEAAIAFANSVRKPKYDLVRSTLREVRSLFEKHHGYKSIGGLSVYVFAVVENSKYVAAFTWNTPAPGAANSVCPEAPYGVLALTRMVALPRNERALRHISKPLRRQMHQLIDRGRWPVLVTYSDEGQGHTGYVYKCSGWTPTLRSKARTLTAQGGVRISTYQNGGVRDASLYTQGTTFIQRWEHRVCEPGTTAEHIQKAGWERVLLPGRMWKSGNVQARWIKVQS